MCEKGLFSDESTFCLVWDQAHPYERWLPSQNSQPERHGPASVQDHSLGCVTASRVGRLYIVDGKRDNSPYTSIFCRSAWFHLKINCLLTAWRLRVPRWQCTMISYRSDRRLEETEVTKPESDWKFVAQNNCWNVQASSRKLIELIIAAWKHVNCHEIWPSKAAGSFYTCRDARLLTRAKDGRSTITATRRMLFSWPQHQRKKYY